MLDQQISKTKYKFFDMERGKFLTQQEFWQCNCSENIVACRSLGKLDSKGNHIFEYDILESASKKLNYRIYFCEIIFCYEAAAYSSDGESVSIISINALPKDVVVIDSYLNAFYQSKQTI